ncbi:hypothetical protein GGX14DRAFT_98453 [Mycena pura]|uniref:Uncharacterized protein n=1 Tax=Mycena pura TaxID=153505 RepID=A0AAD6YRI1_9AGAR|nr:hypothetical protein GGX14DRAFT_98453 [Mycena pura]
MRTSSWKHRTHCLDGASRWIALPVEDITKVPFIIPNLLSREFGIEPSSTMSKPLKTVEMTCGSLVEEHFWPIRYQIRHQQLQPYENAIEALRRVLALQAAAAQKKTKKNTVAKLTNDLASLGRVSASTLSSFLDECRAQRERLLQLWQIASELEMGVINNELVEDAIWEGNLIILAVFHEILTSKADLEDVAALQGGSAQFVLDLIQDVRNDPLFVLQKLRFH